MTSLTDSFSLFSIHYFRQHAGLEPQVPFQQFFPYTSCYIYPGTHGTYLRCLEFNHQ